MTLEEIVGRYGWTDYYDQMSGYVYQLSAASVEFQRMMHYEEIDVPTRDLYSGNLVGYTSMKNPEVYK